MGRANAKPIAFYTSARIEEYREMLLAWKMHGVVVICGYIIGFPADTKASILRDVDIIKRKLPIDLLYLNFLTPLPGCEEHKRLQAAGGFDGRRLQQV